MSTCLHLFRCFFPVLAVCLLAATDLSAQAFEAEITINSERSLATVTGKLNNPLDYTPINLSFISSVAGHRDLARRIRAVEVFDRRGAPAQFRKLTDSEYLGEQGIVSWRYEIDLAPLSDKNAAAHISWLSGNKGLLMLADILPILRGRGRVSIRVPEGWSIFTNETPETVSAFRDVDTSRAVFAVGSAWQQTRSPDPKHNIDLIIEGRWHFTGPESAAMAAEIFEELDRTFGGSPGGRRQVILANFPVNAVPGHWQAETRGRTVTIISSDMPFRTQSLQRLHEQLRHELFHLWIPNDVHLEGNYDWFYEGFALYESLKLGVRVNRIRFEDFLDTLSRAHTIDSAPSQRTSLIQASTTRFSGSHTQIYARGMLVAFLCDLAMLRDSKGKRSVEMLLKELYGKHRGEPNRFRPVDANTAVLDLLRSSASLVPVVERYIVGSDRIDWAMELESAGIEDTDSGILTSLRVRQKLNGKQKTLLDKLGYNSWRKLSRTSK